MSELEKNLMADIEKTGYPVELRAGNVFVKSGWSVYYNRYYLDRDEKKGREIDLVAFNAISSKEHRAFINLCLVSEVKKSENPWVIFSTEGTSESGLEEPGWRRLHEAFDEINPQVLPTEKLEEKSTIHEFKRYGHGFYVAFTGPQSKPIIFEALASAVKAAEDSLRHLNTILTEDGIRFQKNTRKGRSLFLFEPMVILEGSLYEAYLDKSDKLVRTRINHIPVCFGYLSPEYKHADLLGEYIVEIVTLDSLSELLSKK